MDARVQRLVPIKLCPVKERSVTIRYETVCNAEPVWAIRKQESLLRLPEFEFQFIQLAAHSLFWRSTAPISIIYSIGQKFRSTNMAKRDPNSVEILKCNYAKGHFSTINIELG